MESNVSKGYATVVLCDSVVTFLGERERGSILFIFLSYFAYNFLTL